MTRFQPALKAFAGLIAATALATACGATTTENQAASETTVTTTVTTQPAAKASKPVPLVSIPPKKPTTAVTVVPTVKPPKKVTPTKKPTVHLTTTKPKPKPTKPKPTKTAEAVYYANCSAVRAAGAAPIYRGEPGYSSKLDRDGDGVACEN
jgi:outer membrane biosynthesis protein TonB